MIETLKDLEKFFKVCRKMGVIKADLVNQAFEFGDLPIEHGAAEVEQEPYKGFPTGTLTEEQLMFYSSGGLPENDPALKAAG